MKHWQHPIKSTLILLNQLCQFGRSRSSLISTMLFINTSLLSRLRLYEISSLALAWCSLWRVLFSRVDLTWHAYERSRVKSSADKSDLLSTWWADHLEDFRLFGDCLVVDSSRRLCLIVLVDENDLHLLMHTIVWNWKGSSANGSEGFCGSCAPATGLWRRYEGNVVVCVRRWSFSESTTFKSCDFCWPCLSAFPEESWCDYEEVGSSSEGLGRVSDRRRHSIILIIGSAQGDRLIG